LVAQGRRHVGVSSDAGMREALIDEPQDRFVAVGIAGQGTRGLGAFRQCAQCVLGREVAGL
jgi:hypothetical protein